MYLIQQVTSNSLQQLSLILFNGNVLNIKLYFRSMQQGWFISNLTYDDLIINELRITVSPNMLNQFRNQIPFGLGCFTSQSREPSLLEDFSSGNFKLYILDTVEVNEYVRLLSKGS
jgi:hypothetical protein